MTKYFDSISSDEKKVLKDTFVYITLLIASAENKLTLAEKEAAIKTIKVRGYEANSLFNEFYDEINNTFAEELEQASAEHKISRDEIDYFSRKISQVNEVNTFLAVTQVDLHLTKWNSNRESPVEDPGSFCVIDRNITQAGSSIYFIIKPYLEYTRTWVWINEQVGIQRINNGYAVA